MERERAVFLPMVFFSCLWCISWWPLMAPGKNRRACRGPAISRNRRSAGIRHD